MLYWCKTLSDFNAREAGLHNISKQKERVPFSEWADPFQFDKKIQKAVAAALSEELSLAEDV
ncbi:hypothetical protein ACFL5G_05890, partial [Candidatus Margulisiibacteriota bacterium]